MDILIAGLSLDPIIIDKTGLQGRLFDFKLTYLPYTSPMRQPPPPTTEPGAGDSLFVAIEEQLGLKLVAAKGPRTYYTIEHVERPSPN